MREYLEKKAADSVEDADQEKIEFRFQEYQKKYTVYDNIVLFDEEGQLLHQLDETQTTLFHYHPIVALARQ